LVRDNGSIFSCDEGREQAIAGEDGCVVYEDAFGGKARCSREVEGDGVDEGGVFGIMGDGIGRA